MICSAFLCPRRPGLAEQLWTAPELLRDPMMGADTSKHAVIQNLQRGDVHSFALILHEMLFRKGAFYQGEDVPGVELPSPQEILALVKAKPVDDEHAYRPLVPKGEPEEPGAVGEEDKECHEKSEQQKLVELMRDCWMEAPIRRPDFSCIRKAVHALNKENETSNLVDNLLKRMEQYATNLEGLVEERTQEYLSEKKKVEELLHQLLPPSVADQLIAGNSVQPETYDCVTIYFSDIVGFTALSSASSAMQVVTLLNDLYLAFDSVVDNFKVYKVETIGECGPRVG